MAILITHPGRQHSHQAALALHRNGLLAAYWSGVPAVAEHFARLPASIRRRLPYAPVALDAERARAAPWCPAWRRLGDRWLPAAAARGNDFAACRIFDHWAARGVARLRPAGVIACEISALVTFRAARRLGLLTILDAPSFHHQAQDRLHGTRDSPALHRRIAGVKDAEIEAADHVVTVSELARRTYLDAGVPGDKVHAVPLGVDLELFQPAAAPRTPASAGDAFTFLFAGATIQRKGFDLLLAAFERVAAAESSSRLRVVGPVGDAAYLLGGHDPRRISVRSVTDQRGLAAEMRSAHCLVLPSRNDSFGMVVPEALASGLPVLVSAMVGAKDLVVEGRNGWIVPAEDVAALAERMLLCVQERAVLRAMGESCRRSAEMATWDAYHGRFAALITSLLGARAA